jgi:hypothetical protein
MMILKVNGYVHLQIAEGCCLMACQRWIVAGLCAGELHQICTVLPAKRMKSSRGAIDVLEDLTHRFRGQQRWCTCALQTVQRV